MTKIIAEIGWNHMGDMELAKEMVTAAMLAGADCAKFQTFNVTNLKSGPWDHDGRREIYEKAQLTLEQHKELHAHCKKVGIGFMSSAFTVKDAELLAQVSTESIKIPSMEARNEELVDFCAKTFSKVFMSTGAADIAELDAMVGKFKEGQLVLFHCVSTYPCPPENANLSRIDALRGRFEKMGVTSFGYSDHVEDILVAAASLEHGVEFIEKHFTTDNDLPGRDNKFAVLPEHINGLRHYIDTKELANIDRGVDHQECESEVRSVYVGRWLKK
jgi:N,N'-diacetyllegionaminate synthase